MFFSTIFLIPIANFSFTDNHSFQLSDLVKQRTYISIELSENLSTLTAIPILVLKSSLFWMWSSISFLIVFNWSTVVSYWRVIIQLINQFEVSLTLTTAFSANWKLGIIANDLSNFLIVVDLNPIFSTIPSIIPSTNIQSPILNLFSTRTKIPEIKFLNKSRFI